MTNWKETTLGDLVRCGFILNHNNKRVPLSSEVRSKMKGVYPYYGAASAIDFINEYKFDGFFLLIAEDGTVFDGRAPMLQLVSGKFWVSNHSHVLQGKDNQATKLLYYVLKNVAIAPYITGAVQPKLTKENLYKISFPFPESPEEQKEIAGALSSLDDKIELLREENKSLDATAQAIFKEWFVNFNFPKAEGKPYKSSGGKMIDSELGEIPEGWRVRRLGVEVNIAYGKNLPTTNLQKEGYPVFGGNGQIGFFSKFLYEDQQVLISCRGEASGKVNISLPNSFVTNNSLILEIPKDSNLNFSFLKYFSLNTDYEVYVSGSAQPQITIETIKHCPILIPDRGILLAYEDVAKPTTEKILVNNSQIQTLSTLRDTLLPKLMSDEAKIKEDL